MKKNIAIFFIIISILGMVSLLYSGIKFNITHRKSGMISVVAGSNEIKSLSIDLKEYLPFDKNSKINYKKSNFQINENIPILDGASALYPVFSAIASSTYPEKSVCFDGENFTKESKVQMRNTRGAYKAIVDGTSDIIFCAAPSEEQLLYAKEKNIELEFVPIGFEAFVFIENIKNPVNDLSIEEIKGIYSGKIKNWKKVGGTNTLIAAWQRKEGSGSQTAFLNFMKGEPINSNPLCIFFGSPIGYSFRYYVEGITKNENVKMVSLNGIAPTKENIQNGKYPISSNFFAVYRKNDQNENIKKLIDWIISPEGQRIIDNNGYVSLNK
ncbi:PstS family phosphate ABC transporter substrate-binding protein [Treponema sp. C6A8]|uniref:PstS family phosphate ABC transporter substrate-binding protein n=1 Tax=Treponema sp. C6A8 TaxID=1410609 RepID=UPI00048479FA|nr:substrate-binding domain-containing protein [Treponema sp. C6A8]